MKTLAGLMISAVLIGFFMLPMLLTVREVFVHVAAALQAAGMR